MLFPVASSFGPDLVGERSKSCINFTFHPLIHASKVFAIMGWPISNNRTTYFLPVMACHICLSCTVRLMFGQIKSRCERRFLPRNILAGVSLVVECGTFRYINKKFAIFLFSNIGSSLIAFRLCLKVLTNCSANPLDGMELIGNSFSFGMELIGSIFFRKTLELCQSKLGAII